MIQKNLWKAFPLLKEKKSPQNGHQMVEVKLKFLHNISHHYNNIFAFHMLMFIIFVLNLQQI
jgi:hypothetical protein